MVYFGIAGRLGNWMFQYANAMSFGGGVSRGYIVEEWSKSFVDYYREMFPNLQIADELPKGIKVYEEKRFGFDRIDVKGDNVLLKGYFQSEKYFDEKVVRRLYEIAPEREAYLKGKYGQWLSRPNVTGISVRRGDYMVNLENFPFVGGKYLKDCIALVSECNDFIVCSDDIAWCRKFFTTKRFPGKSFLFIEDESPFNQLYIHALCKNNILSNSSFSWWGGWLNKNPKKRVLAPSLWFGFYSLRRRIDWSDIYFKGVEVVENHYSVWLYVYAHLYWWQKKLKDWIRRTIR